MIYEIKRGNDTLASVHAIGSQIVDVMQQDRVNMSFALPAPVNFKRGDKVNVYGQTYQLNRTDNRAKTNQTLGVKYDLEFEAQYYDLAKWELKGLDKNNQLTLSEVYVTGTAAVIVDLLVRNANRADSGWSVGVVDDTETEQYTYVNQSLLSVLVDLATRHDTEFWVDNKTIHLQKREQQSGLTLSWGMGNGLYELFRGRTDKSVINRLFVEGGTRNLPEGYGFSRLQLPEASRPFLQVPIPPNEKVIERTEFFENIFPSRIGSVTALGANELIIIDNTLDFDINACKLPGLEYKVSFTSGQLASFDFDIDTYVHATKTITLKRIEDNKAYPDGIPSELLKPAIGDKYVLLDIEMPASYKTEAENKLLAAGQAFLDDNKDDKHEYTANLTPIWVKKTNPTIRLGYTVRILEPDLNIDKELRISGYVRDLQEPALYTDFKLSEKLKPAEIIRQYAQQERILLAISTAGLLDPEQMRKNLFLNRLSERDGYLMLGSDKIKAGYADLAANSLKWNGLLQPDYLTQPVRPGDSPAFAGVSSPLFVSGFSGSGYRVVNENGDIHATFDKLTVRKEMNVYELVVNQIRASNGSVWISDAIKIFSVTVSGSNYICAIDTDGNKIGVPFVVNDILRCQRWTGRNVKYYVVRVTAIASGSFTVVKLDGGGIPEAGDDVVRMGNSTNVNRQGALYLTASDSNAPYMDVIDGVTSASLVNKTKVRTGKLDGIVDPDFGALSGYGLFGDNVYLKNGYFKGSVTITGGNASTKDYADQSAANAANSIQIGGTNLFSISPSNWVQGGYHGTGGAWDSAFQYRSTFSSVKPNKTYIAKIHSLPAEINYVFLIETSGIQQPYTVSRKDLMTTGELVFTTASDTTHVCIYIYTNGAAPTDSTIASIRIKLEDGNKATAWSPAPGDMVITAAIDAQTKATAAQNAAISTAASDATSKDNALKTLVQNYADSVALSQANIAKTAAISAASTDAQSKADTARILAENASIAYTNSVQIGAVNLFSANPSNWVQGGYSGSGTTWDNAIQWKSVFTKVDSNKSYRVKIHSLPSAISYVFLIETSGIMQPTTASRKDLLSSGELAFTTAANTTHVCIYIYTNGATPGDTMISNIRIKLEEGDKFTSWSPTPADVAILIADADAKAVAAQAAYTNLTLQLKPMAYESVVEFAKLGTTVVNGGYIKGELLEVAYIKANIINAQYINSIAIEATTIKVSGESKTGQQLIDGITIGGTNLLSRVFDLWITGGYNSAATWDSGSGFRTFRIPVTPNTKYTLRRFGGTSTTYVQESAPRSPIGGRVGFALGGATITTASNAAYIAVSVYLAGGATQAYVEAIISKVELGEKATDWSPAPEDYLPTGQVLIGNGKIRADRIETNDLIARQFETTDGRLSLNKDDNASFIATHANGQKAVGIGTNNEGSTFIEIYNNAGVKTHELSSKGLVAVTSVSGIWKPAYMFFTGQTAASPNTTAVINAITPYLVAAGDYPMLPESSVRHLFDNGTVTADAIYNGYHTAQVKATNNWIANGWYVFEGLPFQAAGGQLYKFRVRLIRIVNGQQTDTNNSIILTFNPNI